MNPYLCGEVASPYVRRFETGRPSHVLYKSFGFVHLGMWGHRQRVDCARCVTGNVRDFAVRGPVHVQCAFVIVRGLLLSISYFSALSMCRIYDTHHLNLVPILSTAVKFIYNLLAIALSDMSQTGSEAQRNCLCDDVTTSTKVSPWFLIFPRHKIRTHN